MTYARVVVVGCSVLPLLLSGCGAPEGNEANGVAPPSDIAIVNGVTAGSAFASTYGMVGVYHHDSAVPANWFPRPCSGTIVWSQSSTTWVLTARHCVTTDLTVTGPVQTNPQSFRLLPGASPGPSSPSSPPAGSITPNLIVAAPISSQQLDMALIRVTVDWSEIVSAAALLMSPVSSLPNAPVTATGYGVSNLDTSCNTDYDQTGAGIARYAAGFTVDSATGFTYGGAFTYPNTSAGAQAHIICGDSGGMDMTTWPRSDPQYSTQIGVHSSVDAPIGTGDAHDTFSGSWVSNIIDGIYLFQVGVGNVSWNSSNFNLVFGPTAFPDFIYIEQQQLLAVDFGDYSMCVQKRSSTDNHAMLALCNQSAAQLWQVTADNRIRNPSTNTCLQPSGSSVIVTACVASNAPLAARRAQTWYWGGTPFTTD